MSTENKTDYFYLFKRLFNENVSPELIRYGIESFRFNDEAHRVDHIYKVCCEAVSITNIMCAKREISQSDIPVIYHAAFLHDIGCRFDRKTHHLIGAEMLPNILNLFGGRKFDSYEIAKMGLAIMEHRSSNPYKPSNMVSSIVSLADTGKPDIFDCLQRSIKFRDYRNMPEEQLYKEVSDHLEEKYGPNGYHWNSYPDIGLDIYSDEWRIFKHILSTKNMLNDLTYYNHFKSALLSVKNK